MQRFFQGPIALGCIFLGSALLTGTGCAAKDDAKIDPKEDDFAVLPVTSASSVLPAIEDAEGQPDVCVGLIGYANDAERQDAFDRLTTQITSAANQWNALLQGNSLWHFKGSVLPSYVMQPSECTRTDFAGFSVNLWKSAPQFKKEFCAKNFMAERDCSSAALPNRRTFYLGPWNRTLDVDPLDAFTSLHEYGHLLGLGDTYRIPNVSDFEGEQPASVMNGLSFTLTEDDKLGLWATLRAVKTGVRSCDGLAEASDFTINGFNALLCNTQAIAVNNHAGRVTGADVPEPPTGPLPESTLNEINNYQVASLQLNCRTGAGTENPVVTKVVQGTPLTAAPGTFGQPRIAYSTEGRPWLRVNVAGQTCYASASVQFIMPIGVIPMSTLQQVDRYAISTQMLNCRSGAGTEFPVLQTLPLGTKITADPGNGSQQRIAFTTDGNPWILVRANDRLCYASGNFKFIVPQL